LGLYGGGALLIREATVRWRKRWGAVLLLGGAYAAGVEGFAAKTMINPMSPIIGNQLYTNCAAVYWVPLTILTVFHAAISIAMPPPRAQLHPLGIWFYGRILPNFWKPRPGRRLRGASSLVAGCCRNDLPLGRPHCLVLGKARGSI